MISNRRGFIGALGALVASGVALAKGSVTKAKPSALNSGWLDPKEYPKYFILLSDAKVGSVDLQLIGPKPLDILMNLRTREKVMVSGVYPGRITAVRGLDSSAQYHMSRGDSMFLIGMG